MQRLVEIGLSNALAASVLALIVALVTRWVKRPAIRHALWVLVLLKLVTPSLFTLPTGIHVEWVNVPETASPVVNAGPTPPQKSGSFSRPGRGSGHLRGLPPESWTVRWGIWLWATTRPSYSTPVALILTLWVVSAGVVASRKLWGIARFAWDLRQAWVPDEDLQHQADKLAHRYGLQRSPPVLLVPGCTNPMLWAVGPTVRILFPAQLLRRMDESRRATLLAHELAHFRRGDHWVRVLELVVSSVFWWHPVVWWARKQIEIAEEECCDAWVVSQFPEMPRRYAEALLDAVDFLNDRHRVPALASGIGDVPFLKHRLTLIMRGTIQPRMSGPMRCLVLVLAATFLPLRPGLVQSAAAVVPDPPVVQPPVVLKKPTRISRTVSQKRPIRKPVSRSMPPVQAQVSVPPPVPLIPPAPVSTVWATVVSPTGDAKVTKDSRSQVLLRHGATGRTFVLEAGDEIDTVAFSPDGKWLATGGRLRLLIWDVQTGRIFQEFAEATGIQSLIFTPQAKHLIAGTLDGRVCVWNMATRLLMGELPATTSSVNCLAVSADGRTMAVASGSWRPMGDADQNVGRVTLWSIPELKLRLALDSPQPVGAVAFRTDDNTVIGGGWDGHATVWSARTGAVEMEGTVSKDVISVARFSSDCRALGEATIEQPPEPMMVEEPMPMPIGLFFNSLLSVPAPAGN